MLFRSVEQHVVDAPAVDADRGDGGAARQGLGGEAEAGERLVPEGADLPVVVPVEGAEGVGEAVDLAEREPVPGPRAEDHAAAGGAEVEGDGVDGTGHGGDFQLPEGPPLPRFSNPKC